MSQSRSQYPAPAAYELTMTVACPATVLEFSIMPRKQQHAAEFSRAYGNLLPFCMLALRLKQGLKMLL